MPFYNLREIDFRQKQKGIYGKIVDGEKMQMALVHLDFGIETNHSHPNEQIGYVLSGSAEIQIGKEKRICGAGEAYLIPSDVKHGFKVLSQDGMDYMEIFCPPKEENRNVNNPAQRTGL
ncbi:MAG: cupin domain-containing protein [Deltaproteobacteria bacterium]|nr:cupin domain-containing protein [Deltaproteobacteria bacterium]